MVVVPLMYDRVIEGSARIIERLPACLIGWNPEARLDQMRVNGGNHGHRTCRACRRG
ncbi:hypothetical protein KL86PLE_90599 [uncultured Pleomorphomonas sp.]|uniref:Uncharacterized protein n=1 Tax=uncultured Pleomorphomonas sp. TaxID=442121 RepID=A0A212LQI9_9HYPH|nr:hypothetical protein KL86PLE_90599 [uncultured Pleomorphomonas sp.]